MAPVFAKRSDGYELSDDKTRLNLPLIAEFLKGAYWSRDIPADVVRRAIEGSWCFGVYAPDEGQVGFARLITDYATFAYLADVFVVDTHRGLGLAGWLMNTMFEQEAVKALRRITLATRDAHSLYKKVGFTPLARPEIFMEIVQPGIYARTQ